MFKKLFISAALVAGATSIGAAGVQAMPLCKMPGPCLQKMPNIPINPIIKPIKFKPVPIIPITPLPIGPTPAPTPSGPSIGINVNLGDGGYEDGSDYVTCREAKSIVRQHGYRHVHTQSCGDGDYSFFATRHGTPFVVEVSDSGEILNADIAD